MISYRWIDGLDQTRLDQDGLDQSRLDSNPRGLDRCVDRSMDTSDGYVRWPPSAVVRPQEFEKPSVGVHRDRCMQPWRSYDWAPVLVDTTSISQLGLRWVRSTISLVGQKLLIKLLGYQSGFVIGGLETNGSNWVLAIARTGHLLQLSRWSCPSDHHRKSLAQVQSHRIDYD